jgi:RNA polymerase sigma-70 factor (ECF subfamily)
VVGSGLTDSLVRELYDASGAARWNIAFETFAARLNASVAARFSPGALPAREAESFARSLHTADLALACGCAAGDEAAWEHFVREYRPAIYAAARAVTRSDAARELADSLYGQLFGVDARGQQRRSLFDYYHGRARLSTWLRSVLVQRHIDALRQAKRTVPLDDSVPEPAAPIPDDPDAEANLGQEQRALDAAIAALEPRDRLRLRLYYGEALTLAKVGRALGEHEATVSRNLDRIRKAIREQLLGVRS